MFTPLIICWVLLATVVIGLAFYRKMIARQEDDSLHVGDVGGSAITRQVQVAKKLESIDRWGKTLTVFIVVYGVALLGYFLYLGWLTGTTIHD